MNIKWAEKLRKGLHGSADSLGNLCVEAFHYLALFGIGAITAYAAVMTFLDMLGKGGVSVDDILLLFIYLELGAMVGIYFKTNHMPIRFLLYVAITALTRLLIGDVSHHKAPGRRAVVPVRWHPVAGVRDPGGALRLVPLPLDQGTGCQRQGSGGGRSSPQLAMKWRGSWRASRVSAAST
ncbi:phosphate-starvation-inducible E [Pseudomonas putida S11]|nr:phosphate-starvation-inducible E [Pseudomonas putida S11]